MLDDLKACPFCGATDGTTQADENQGTKWGGVVCSCGVRGPEVRTAYDLTENAPWRARAVEAWNERSSAPAPAAAEPVGKVYSVHRMDDATVVTFDLAPGVTLKVGQPLYAEPLPGGEGRDSARLDFIERTFSGMTNRERYLPVQMIWGKGCNGRTLREACDKYMNRETEKPWGEQHERA